MSTLALSKKADYLFIAESGFDPGTMPDVAGFAQTAYCSKDPRDSVDGSPNNGGVAVWQNVNSKIKTLYTTQLSTVRNFQAVAIHTVCGNYVLFYRSPSQTMNNMSETADILEKYVNESYTLIGDLNIRDVDWKTGDTGKVKFDGPAVRKIIKILTPDFMKQIVTKPTHIGGGILDVIVLNSQTIATVDILHEHTPQEENSMKFDHFILETKIETEEFAHCEKPVHIIDHSKTNWALFRSILSDIDWDKPRNLPLNLQISYLCSKLRYAYDKWITMKLKKPKRLSVLRKEAI